MVTVKSVNHRGLDIHFHMSAELDVFENALRVSSEAPRLARAFPGARRTSRGRRRPAPVLNRGLLEAYFGAFRQAAAEHGHRGRTRPERRAARCPACSARPAASSPSEAAEQFLVSALEEAVRSLNAFREREGKELAAELTARAPRPSGRRLARMRGTPRPSCAGIPGAPAPSAWPSCSRGTSVEPQRLAQEAALLADRSDISEEIDPPAGSTPASWKTCSTAAAKSARSWISCSRR